MGEGAGNFAAVVIMFLLVAAGDVPETYPARR